MITRAYLCTTTRFSISTRFLSTKTLTASALSSAVGRECYLEWMKEEEYKGTNTRITLLNLNRPNAKNALGKQMLDDLEQCLNYCNNDSNTRVLLVRSTVDKVFCSGADLKERASMKPDEVEQFILKLQTTFQLLDQLKCCSIGLIEGFALGGGLEFALCTDFRIAGPKAILGLPETSLAIIPGAGGTQRLPRLIGVTKAKEMIYTSSRIDGDEAARIGLVSLVSNDPMKEALKLASKILPNGPLAISAAKEAINKGMQKPDLEEAMKVERECYAKIIPTNDRLEGLKAFKEKRKPNYTGH